MGGGGQVWQGWKEAQEELITIQRGVKLLRPKASLDLCCFRGSMGQGALHKMRRVPCVSKSNHGIICCAISDTNLNTLNSVTPSQIVGFHIVALNPHLINFLGKNEFSTFLFCASNDIKNMLIKKRKKSTKRKACLTYKKNASSYNSLLKFYVLTVLVL